MLWREKPLVRVSLSTGSSQALAHSVALRLPSYIDNYVSSSTSFFLWPERILCVLTPFSLDTVSQQWQAITVVTTCGARMGSKCHNYAIPFTRTLILLGAIWFTGAALASPIPVHTETVFSNQNWFPLPEHDMKAAAIDSALSVLSEGGHFVLVLDDQGSDERMGTLEFHVSLIEPAETAKLTIILHLPDGPSYISSASTSLHGKDYQGIYEALESIGRSAAKRLNAKLTESPKKSPGEPIGTQEPGAIPDDPAAKGTYEQGQRLKEQLRFAEARDCFEKVATINSPGSSRWASLSADELRYGLPVFEAKQWLLNVGKSPNDHSHTNHCFIQAEELFRQALKENTHDTGRIQELQRYLDEIAISRRAFENAARASAMSRAHHLRIVMLQYFVEMGGWPDENCMKSEVFVQVPDLTIEHYRRDHGTIILTVKDIRSNQSFQVIGDARGSVQIK